MPCRSGAAMLAAVLVLGANAAGARDYRSEIMVHVVDPCILEFAKRQAVPGIEPEKLVELVKPVPPEKLNRLVAGLNRLMDTDPLFVTRMTLYKLVLRKCLAGVTEGRIR